MADLEVGKVLVVEGAEEVVLDNYDSNLATRRPRKVFERRFRSVWSPSLGGPRESSLRTAG